MLCLGWTASVTAQQLPNIQAGNQWLPQTAQIDGKLSEWNGSLKAYNKATRVEYTIANDNKNLYLAIRSKDKTTTAKILAGGISFMLNSSGKNTNAGSRITFPATNSTYVWSKDGFPVANFELLSDSVAIRNAILQFKEIKALRFKGVSDSLLSIYNEYNIYSKLAYTSETLICELAIPLNLIGLSPEGSAAFAYTISLNGVSVPAPPKGVMPPPPPPPIIMEPGKNQAPGSYINHAEIDYPTDFSGTYNLLKK